MTTLSALRNLGHLPVRPAPSRLLDLVLTVEAWLNRHEERRALRTLSDATLHDIGLTRADVEREASKPWWQA